MQEYDSSMMYDNFLKGNYTDMVINVTDKNGTQKEYKCHRVVVCTYSGYFKAQESYNPNHFTLTVQSFQHFDIVLQLLYQCIIHPTHFKRAHFGFYESMLKLMDFLLMENKAIYSAILSKISCIGESGDNNVSSFAELLEYEKLLSPEDYVKAIKKCRLFRLFTKSNDFDSINELSFNYFEKIMEGLPYHIGEKTVGKAYSLLNEKDKYAGGILVTIAMQSSTELDNECRKIIIETFKLSLKEKQRLLEYIGIITRANFWEKCKSSILGVFSEEFSEYGVDIQDLPFNNNYYAYAGFHIGMKYYNLK